MTRDNYVANKDESLENSIENTDAGISSGLVTEVLAGEGFNVDQIMESVNLNTLLGDMTEEDSPVKKENYYENSLENTDSIPRLNIDFLETLSKERSKNGKSDYEMYLDFYRDNLLLSYEMLKREKQEIDILAAINQLSMKIDCNWDIFDYPKKDMPLLEEKMGDDDFKSKWVASMKRFITLNNLAATVRKIVKDMFDNDKEEMGKYNWLGGDSSTKTGFCIFKRIIQGISDVCKKTFFEEGSESELMMKIERIIVNFFKSTSSNLKQKKKMLNERCREESITNEDTKTAHAETKETVQTKIEDNVYAVPDVSKEDKTDSLDLLEENLKDDDFRSQWVEDMERCIVSKSLKASVRKIMREIFDDDKEEMTKYNWLGAEGSKKKGFHKFKNVIAGITEVCMKTFYKGEEEEEDFTKRINYIIVKFLKYTSSNYRCKIKKLSEGNRKGVNTKEDTNTSAVATEELDQSSIDDITGIFLKTEEDTKLVHVAKEEPDQTNSMGDNLMWDSLIENHFLSDAIMITEDEPNNTRAATEGLDQTTTADITDTKADTNGNLQLLEVKMNNDDSRSEWVETMKRLVVSKSLKISVHQMLQNIFANAKEEITKYDWQGGEDNGKIEFCKFKGIIGGISEACIPTFSAEEEDDDLSIEIDNIIRDFFKDHSENQMQISSNTDREEQFDLDEESNPDDSIEQPRQKRRKREDESSLGDAYRTPRKRGRNREEEMPRRKRNSRTEDSSQEDADVSNLDYRKNPDILEKRLGNREFQAQWVADMKNLVLSDNLGASVRRIIRDIFDSDVEEIVKYNWQGGDKYSKIAFCTFKRIVSGITEACKELYMKKGTEGDLALKIRGIILNFFKSTSSNYMRKQSLLANLENVKEDITAEDMQIAALTFDE